MAAGSVQTGNLEVALGGARGHHYGVCQGGELVQLRFSAGKDCRRGLTGTHTACGRHWAPQEGTLVPVP